MYGTIAQLKVKEGMAEEMKNAMTAQGGDVPGALEMFVYQMDDNPDELYMVVLFEDKQAYIENSKSRQSDENFKKMMTFLESEPEWHDGEVIYHQEMG